MLFRSVRRKYGFGLVWIGLVWILAVLVVPVGMASAQGGLTDEQRAAIDEASAQAQGGGEIPDLAVGKIERAKGAIKLSELYANKEKYNNQVIKVTGKCVKVNPMIMNRNWIHIRDGSGEDFDLTITTMENVPLGAVVTLEGTVALDKDFGAGYRYDVILEGAVVQ